MKDFSILEKKLNISFTNKDILIQAFCHRSYLNEHPNFHLRHNERLEFLGDAVLELAVTDYLYRHYPEKTEGALTSWRAALVNTDMLSKVALKLDFERFLLLSRGEAKEIKKSRRYLLANTFEAFVGALYLDHDFKKARQFIEKNLIILKLSLILKNKLFKDFKSSFQEKSQMEVSVTPTYKVLTEWGPDHNKHFKVGAFIGIQKTGEGEGDTKQQAEEMAAKNALELKKW